MRKTFLLFALLCALASPLRAQEGAAKIFIITTTAGVKCHPSQKALWVINSGGSAGVYRCSAVNTLTPVGGGGSPSYPLLAPLGSAAAPTYSFNDLDPLGNPYGMWAIDGANLDLSFGYSRLLLGTYVNSFMGFTLSFERNDGLVWFATDHDGHTAPGLNNAYDWGSASNRWRGGYFGTSVSAPKFNLSATVTPSGTADAQGSPGDVRYDDSFIYVKTSAGWKRAALSTF